MLRSVIENSSKVIFTTDNLRTETFKEIFQDAKDGNKLDSVTAIEDRREAIKLGITLCSEGDILLIAGKGHEKYQEINGERFPFDDMAILKEHFKH